MRNKKSPLLGRALTALVLLLLPSSYFAFQAPPDPEGRFKSIIEKKTGEKVKEPPPSPTTKKSSICVSDDIRFPNAISDQVFGARPLSESLSLKTFIPPRKPIPRKLFGFDENPTEYWFHNKIHTFGNTNVFGGTFNSNHCIALTRVTSYCFVVLTCHSWTIPTIVSHYCS